MLNRRELKAMLLYVIFISHTIGFVIGFVFRGLLR